MKNYYYKKINRDGRSMVAYVYTSNRRVRNWLLQADFTDWGVGDDAVPMPFDPIPYDAIFQFIDCTGDFLWRAMNYYDEIENTLEGNKTYDVHTHMLWVIEPNTYPTAITFIRQDSESGELFYEPDLYHVRIFERPTIKSWAL